MPSLLLLRGLPGSGKSTLAAVLSENGRWPVFSVDDYFTDPVSDNYDFRFAENHLAYEQCRRNTEQAMQQGTEKIFLANTFTMDWEMKPYFGLAATYSYTVFVVTVENYHQGQNRHAVSDEQLQKMAEKYKVKLL